MVIFEGGRTGGFQQVWGFVGYNHCGGSLRQSFFPFSLHLTAHFYLFILFFLISFSFLSFHLIFFILFCYPPSSPQVSTTFQPLLVFFTTSTITTLSPHSHSIFNFSAFVFHRHGIVLYNSRGDCGTNTPRYRINFLSRGCRDFTLLQETTTTTTTMTTH